MPDGSPGTYDAVIALSALASLASLGLGLFRSLGKDGRDLIQHRIDTNTNTIADLRGNIGALERRVTEIEKAESVESGERIPTRLREVELAAQRLDTEQRRQADAIAASAAEVKSSSERQEQILLGIEEIKEVLHE